MALERGLSVTRLCTPTLERAGVVGLLVARRPVPFTRGEVVGRLGLPRTASAISPSVGALQAPY
jgi:hypothetical protein